MNEESPMDVVTDLIASIEMHRKEIEKETGLEASRTYSLRRLQEALLQEQETSQPDGGSNPVRVATAEALNAEIRRVGSLSRSSGPRPAQGGGGGRPQQQQPRNFRQDQQRKSPKSRGRRPMGRSNPR